MRMCGIRIRVLFLFVLIGHVAFGQCDPQPEVCNEADCGQVQIALSSDANNVFCQGDNVEILIDESASSDFDILIYYWCDGNVDTLDFADQPGTHTYSLTEDEVCEDDKTDYLMQVIGVLYCGDQFSCRTAAVSLTILHEARSIFEVPSQFCVNEEVTFNSSNNMSCNADEYEWDFGDGNTSNEQYPSMSYSTTGPKVIMLTVTNECGSHSSFQTINVLGLPDADASVSAEAEDCIICLGTDVTFTDLSNIWSTNTIWNITPSGTSNWEYIDTSMNDNSDVVTVEFKQVETYTIELFANNVCGEDTWIKELQVLDGPTIDLEEGPQYCQSGSYTPNVTYTGTIDSYKWTFEGGVPMMSTESNPTNISYSTPGIFTVTLIVNGSCGPLIESTIVTVDELVEVSITVPNQYCQGDPLDTLMANVQGGNWSGPGIIDPVLGVFDPGEANLGNNEITYTYGSGSCTDSDMVTILVLESGDGELADGASFCDNGTYTPDISYSGDITGYSWQFNGASPSMSNEQFPTDITYSSSGTFEVTLIISSGCGEVTLTTQIIVDELVEVNIITPNQYCQGDSLDTLMANVPGGIWSGSGIIDQDLGIFDPGGANLGNNEITYSYGSGSCTDSDMVTILVLESGDGELADGPSFCDNGTYTPDISYSGDITGYSWQFDGASPAMSNEQFPTDITYSSPGTFEVTLIISSDCGEVTLTTEVIVDELIEVSITAPAQYCRANSPDTLIANQQGGEWSGTGIVDVDLGIFDPSQANIGDNLITYTYGSVICEDQDMVTITVVESETVIAENVDVCAYQDTIVFTAIPSGGEWFGPFIDEYGVFDVQAAGVGVFSNDYMYTDVNGCDILIMASAIVEMIPTVDVLDTTFLCVNGGTADLEDVTLSSSNVAGGIFSYLIDGTFIDKDYVIPDNIQNVSIVVQYEVGPCIVSDTAILSLIEPPNLTVGPLDTTLCISAGSIVFESNINGGKWSGPGIDMNTGEVNITSIGEGEYEYQYVILPNSSCEVTRIARLEIIDPSEGLNPGLDVQFCEGLHSTYMLSGTSPEGGYWSGEGILDSISGEIDVSILEMDSLYTYTYCLNYFEFEDCEACVSQTLRINPLPIIQYDLEGGACIGETFTINDSTLYGENYFWDFGDGATSNLQEPTHSYIVSDFYDIVLTVTSPKGCQSMDSREIYVSRPPIVDFSLLLDEGCAPFLVQLENNSFGDDISYQWIIAGDTLTEDVPQNVIIDGISTDSIFEIILNVTNSCGTVTQKEEVLVHPYPIVDIGLSVDEGCSPVTVDFGNLTIGNAETYYWDLGNGVTSIDSIPPQQIYTTTDSLVSTYEIVLISTNECGMDTGLQTVTVYPPDVKAFISIDTTVVCQYDSFDIRSFSTPGSVLTWSVFDSTDTQVAGYEGEEIIIAISEPGTFQIVLYASRCGIDSDTAYISVLPSPDLNFLVPAFVCQGDSLKIENNSPMLSETIWDFGDGMISTDFSPVHSYDTSGIFQISLTGYSTINNCPYTLVQEIEVIGKPTALFTPSTTNGCRPLQIDFSNSSEGASGFNWYWNDGTSISLEENPSHTFLDSGTYVVEFVVFDEFGCFGDTAISNIIVHGLPESIFSTDKDSYCQFYDSIIVTNNSIDDVVYNWTINDIEDDREMPILYSETSGLQTIKLIVENIYGCKDTSEQLITILPSPISEGTLNDSIVCQPFQLMVDNQSQQSNNYIWNINNQETSSDENLDFLLSDAGNYFIELIAINENGCPNDTSTFHLNVKNKPVAEFEATKDSICGLPMSVTFSNLSGLNIIDYNWNFGNGVISQMSDPTTTFTQDEDFLVSLIIENNENCFDTTEQIIEIWYQPIANITLEERSYCEGDTISILNNSQYVNEFLWIIGQSDSITTFSPEFIVSEEGQYSVELIVSYNEFCKDSISIDGGINIYNTPVADFDHIVNMDENVIGDVDFVNLSTGFEWLEWNLGDGTFTNAGDFTHEYDINRGIKVTLYAIDDNDGNITCIDSISKIIEPEWITTFFAPNALSPNYGSDDVRLFTPKGIGLKKYELSIYSPWGLKVWSSTALEDGHPLESWNGLIDNVGNEVAQGAYSWIAEVEFVDGRVGVYKGSVTVLR